MHFVRQLPVPGTYFFPAISEETASLSAARWARDYALVGRLARFKRGNARSWVVFRPWRERFAFFLPRRRGSEHASARMIKRPFDSPVQLVKWPMRKATRRFVLTAKASGNQRLFMKFHGFEMLIKCIEILIKCFEIPIECYEILIWSNCMIMLFIWILIKCSEVLINFNWRYRFMYLQT